MACLADVSARIANRCVFSAAGVLAVASTVWRGTIAKEIRERLVQQFRINALGYAHALQ